MFNQHVPSYVNPILSGFYPDPSVCRVNQNYFLVNSTFEYLPGIPIFKSANLVDWTHIGNAIDRGSQIEMISPAPSGGLYAPTIRHYGGCFYIVCTNVSGKGNFLITASDPAGPWSDPIWIEGAQGIDPSLYFENDGKCFYIGNGNPEQPLYDGHHNLWLQQIDPGSGRLIGQKTILVDGGSDISTEPIWIEGPHLYKWFGRYSIVAAEGGTGSYHSVVAFRTERHGEISGPYHPCPSNPIVTNRGLTPNRPNPITCTGHADLIETENGDLWMVLLGCQPYEEGYFNTGRETFLVPMTWKDEWPHTLDNSGLVKSAYHSSLWGFPSSQEPEEHPESFYDDFDIPILNPKWLAIGKHPAECSWLEIDHENSRLCLAGTQDTVGQRGNPAFIGYRQKHSDFTAIANVELSAPSQTLSAGLIAAQNNRTFLGLIIQYQADGPYLSLIKKDLDCSEELLSTVRINPGEIALHIEGLGALYIFTAYQNLTNDPIMSVETDGKILSTEYAGGFVGALIGMYASNKEVEPLARLICHRYDYTGKLKRN